VDSAADEKILAEVESALRRYLFPAGSEVPEALRQAAKVAPRQRCLPMYKIVGARVSRPRSTVARR